jgi:hypothetical protein
MLKIKMSLFFTCLKFLLFKIDRLQLTIFFCLTQQPSLTLQKCLMIYVKHLSLPKILKYSIVFQISPHQFLPLIYVRYEFISVFLFYCFSIYSFSKEIILSFTRLKLDINKIDFPLKK